LGRKRKNRILENIRITDIGSEGKSIAKVEGQVIFVTKALPGDLVDLKITRMKKSYMEGLPLRFHELSNMRVKPFCSHFDLCGGCKWQDLPYKEQLRYKQKQVVDNFERIAKVKIPEVREILPSPYDRYYRNKMEFTFSAVRWLRKEEMDTPTEKKETRGVGLHIPGRWDKIVDIQHCHLQKEPSNEIRNTIREFALQNDYTFFDLRKQEGFLRNLIIRTSTTEELMVVPVFFYDDEENRNKLLEHIYKKFPGITSLMYMINPKANDSIYDLEPVLYRGRDHIFEEMDGLKFKLGPKSFFQTNSHQAKQLYGLVKEYAGLKGNEVVYDLYTGTGTIANYVAGDAKSVVGVESVSEAVEDARVNAELNQIDNAAFVTGDMKDILNGSFISTYGKPDVLITDPPRAGMHKNVIKNILEASPRRIVYVSCNPATQSRDINLLSEKYSVDFIQPVDMFPHTYHVENIALLNINQ
jgi:23S rRNA (uracil1939-C5)-methyltransferase